MQRTDYVQARQLAANILLGYKTMAMLTSDLGSKLKALEGSFLDDGITEVKEYTSKLIADIVNAQGAFMTVANELAEFARLLEAGKGTSGAGAVGNGTIHSAAAAAQSASVRSGGAALAPNRKTPRDLAATQFGMVRGSDGNMIYDSPNETNRYLYKEQGSADPVFQGTCGLCSCVNILRLAGVNATEAQLIAYASKTADPDSLHQMLCAADYFDPGMNGGTSPKNRQRILEHFGISSGLFPVETEKDGSVSDKNLTAIADHVTAGRGVILSVYANILRHNALIGRGRHAVTVTSVKKDANGKLLGFFICDSSNNGTAFYPADRIKRALTGAPMNVTYSIIR